MKKPALVKSAVKSLSLDIAPGGQSIHFTELLFGWDHRLRISIKSDSYRQQSYARMEVWSSAALTWNGVASIHHGSMRTRIGLSSLPGGSGLKALEFQADRDELIRLAGLVLGSVA